MKRHAYEAFIGGDKEETQEAQKVQAAQETKAQGTQEALEAQAALVRSEKNAGYRGTPVKMGEPENHSHRRCMHYH